MWSVSHVKGNIRNIRIVRKHNIAAYSICLGQSNFKISIRGRITVGIIHHDYLWGIKKSHPRSENFVDYFSPITLLNDIPHCLLWEKNLSDNGSWTSLLLLLISVEHVQSCFVWSIMCYCALSFDRIVSIKAQHFIWPTNGKKI